MSGMHVRLRNDEVLAAYGPEVLWDSRLQRIKIDAVLQEAVITLEFKLIRLDQGRVRIRFSEVHEFAFNHNSGLNFYNVASLKFFATPLGFYLSLDPASEASVIDASDNDVIHCATIEVIE